MLTGASKGREPRGESRGGGGARGGEVDEGRRGVEVHAGVKWTSYQRNDEWKVESMER